jgi:hypothetical protein
MRNNEAMAGGVRGHTIWFETDTDSSPPLPTSTALLLTVELQVAFNLPSLVWSTLRCLALTIYLVIAIMTRVLVDVTLFPTTSCIATLLLLWFASTLQDAEATLENG